MFSMSGVALGSKVVQGMSSSQSLSLASVQAVTPLSISKQIQQPSFDTRNLTRTMEEQLSASLLADDMLLSQVQLQKQATVQVQEYVSPVITHDMYRHPKVSQQVLTSGSGFKLPFIPLDDSISKKTKKQYLSKDFSKGYRFRTWKVPTMKDFMKGVF